MGMPSPAASKGAGGMAAAMGAISQAAVPASDASDASEYAKECPPDVEVLGRSSWTLLHSMAAKYPEAPTQEQQRDMTQFIGLFAKLYPCWFCAKDFQKFIAEEKPKVQTQEEFGRWLCDAHNEVNAKLGKPKFDCQLWKQRWKDGWGDDRC